MSWYPDDVGPASQAYWQAYGEAMCDPYANPPVIEWPDGQPNGAPE